MEEFFNSKECINLQENGTLQLTFSIFDKANAHTRNIEGIALTSIEDAKDINEKSITQKVI